MPATTAATAAVTSTNGERSEERCDERVDSGDKDDTDHGCDSCDDRFARARYLRDLISEHVGLIYVDKGFLGHFGHIRPGGECFL